ncbi:TPR-like protein [Tricholoma matsutake]|nr:TPR-like protein [Tricholoma matsutake 945]
MSDLLSRSPSPPTEGNKASVDVTISLQQADILKAEGNDRFRSKRWDEALVAYQTGLSRLPSKSQNEEPSTHDDNSPNEDGKVLATPDEADHKAFSPSELEDCAIRRSILNANIGACYVKLGDHKSAIDACTAALRDDPKYVKALQRRAASNEALNSWTSLSAAGEDYTTLLKLLPPSSPAFREIERSLQSLKPRTEAAQKKETAEMMDKLKGLGNSILGNFGLSTDNFKFEPNGQGGYSVNFSR